MAVERTPDEWMRLKHPTEKIVDPDGWRGVGGRSFDDPITESEFNRRYIVSTIREGVSASVTNDTEKHSHDSTGLDPRVT